MNGDFAAGENDLLAGAGAIIGAFAIDLERGEDTGLLHDFPSKLLQLALDQLFRHMLIGRLTNHLADGIIAVCSGAKQHNALVRLGALKKALQTFGAISNANNENTSSHWVKRAAVAELHFEVVDVFGLGVGEVHCTALGLEPRGEEG